jgi:hypothetical protein
MGGMASLVLLFLLAAVFQTAGPYSRKNAIVTAASLKLHPLPVDSSKAEVTLPGGGSAEIVEVREPWVRIRINGRDGWCRTGDIEPVFPEGVL